MARRIGGRLLPLGALVATLLVPAWASAQSDDVVYYHVDAIGSVRVTTDASGTVIDRYDYLPFGERWQPPATPGDARQFAGKERDTETGLDYFGARYYASGTGRFTTVDPVVDQQKALLDPQRWNRYTYALNNPTRYVDPDGRNVWDLLDIASFGLSVRDVYRDPKSLSNWGALALDTAGLLPIVPSVGTIRRGVDAAKQIDFDFVRQLDEASGLVIGRGFDLRRPGAFSEGEYSFGWFTMIRQGDAASLEREWLVNKERLEGVMSLGRKIRDASSIDDIGGLFLNRERELLRSKGWRYEDGFWIPPVK